MARQTRAERRARRAESMGGEAALSGAPPATPRRPTARAGAQPEPERSRGSGGARRFIGESIGELKKVEWPRQPQVVAGTTVVLIACLVVGIFLYANDKVWTYVVQHWLLGN